MVVKKLELNHQLGENDEFFFFFFAKFGVTVSALHSITAWTWSQPTNTSFQAQPVQKSQLCTHKWERPWTTSFTTRDAFPEVMKKVGGQNPAVFGQISFCVTFFSMCVGFFFVLLLLSCFYGYENRLETDWFSLPPLRRCLVVTEGPSQLHVPLRSSQPSGKISDGPGPSMR